MQDTTIKVHGMSCSGCVNSVTKALEHVPGVKEVKVSLQEKEARVQYDESRTSPQALREAIAESGYQPA